MKHKKHLILAFLFSGLILGCGHPAYAEGLDWSGTSQSALSIYEFISNVIAACMLSIGVGFLGSACLNYKYYRQNPIQTPLNRPVTLLTLAVVLMLFATFIRVTQPLVYETKDKSVTITKIFESKKSEHPKLPPLPQPAAQPTPEKRYAQHNDENQISLDAPYM